MKKEITKEKIVIYPVKPKQTQLCSYALYRFLRRYELIFDFFFFGINLATRADKGRNIATEALIKIDLDITEEERSQKLKNLREENHAFKELQRFGAFQSENMCIRTSDNFMSFVSEIIKSAMLKRPELLKSNETVKIEDIMRFTDYDSLTTWLVEKKLNDLMYSGIRGIEDFLKERTGFKIAENEKEHCLLSICIELRNIYTHNRGRVNEIFLKRLPKYKHDFLFKEGEYFHTEFDDLSILSSNVLNLAKRLDEKIAKKYKTPRKRYSSWLKESKKK